MFDRESSIMGSPYFGNRCHREITDWEAFHVPLLILSVRRRILRRLVCHAFLVGQVDVFRPAVGLLIGYRARLDLFSRFIFCTVIALPSEPLHLEIVNDLLNAGDVLKILSSISCCGSLGTA